LIFNLIAKM